MALNRMSKTGHVDREFTPAAGDGLSLGADPVAQVGVGQDRGRLLGEGGGLHEQLDRAGDVLEGGEAERPVTPDTGQATGHPDHVTGADVRLEPVVTLVQLGGGDRPVEPERVRVDPLGRQDLPLFPAIGAQRVQDPGLGLLVARFGLVGHGLSSSSVAPGWIPTRKLSAD
jgi:hypothetical protein